MPITRRRLLTTSGASLAGGGAAAMLAACGSEREEPSTERDVELLEAAYDAEGSVARLYELAAEQSLESEATDAVAAFGQQATEQVEQLADAIESAGGSPGQPSGEATAAESVIESISLALDSAIAAYHAAVGYLSTPELRAIVLGFVATDAAQLAVIRGLLGDEQAPDAFVTGGEEPPLTGRPEESGS